MTSSRFSEFVKFQRARIHRVRRMSNTEAFRKLCERASRAFSYRNIVRRIAYHLNVHSIRLHDDRYLERPEVGPQNIEIKKERERLGGPFEPYSVTVVNRAATCLLGSAENILEVGCGTGMFSFMAASDENRKIVASEMDAETLDWAKRNRNRQNIRYTSQALADFGLDEFDMVVAIELIEHVSDFAAFLHVLSRVAPSAIVTTPNKNRSPFDSIANTPAYSGHVREWTAGEFYWVLRAFYANVDLFTIPDYQADIERLKQGSDRVPDIARCSVLEQSEPLLALCTLPIRQQT